MSIDYSQFKFSKGKGIAKVEKELKTKPRANKGNKRVTVDKQVYEQVKEICKGHCQLCGTNKNLQLHHINGRGKFLTDNIENCIFLCLNCHLNIVHKNLKKYRPILIKKRKELNK